jgi:nucleotide-binding universal stress UspA family protein
MKAIQKILVPTDFSEGSQAAYRYAQKMASLFGAKIDFIHIVPLVKYFSESIKKMGVPFDMDQDLYPHVIEEAEHKMMGEMEDYIVESNRGKAFVKIDRKPSETIVEHAQEGDYDMIVMGSRGAHRTDLFQGTTTERVIRYSEKPVLSVPDDANADDLGTILMPSDTSDLSFECLPVTLAMASAFDGKITLFHVLELYGSLSENIPHEPDQDEMDAIYINMMEKLRKSLDKLGDGGWSLERGEQRFHDVIVIKKDGKEHRIPVFTEIVKGVSAHREIKRYAEEKVDLIVMATHGRSGLAHLLLGSTTEQISNYVDVPTITIRPAKEKLTKK